MTLRWSVAYHKQRNSVERGDNNIFKLHVQSQIGFRSGVVGASAARKIDSLIAIWRRDYRKIRHPHTGLAPKRQMSRCAWRRCAAAANAVRESKPGRLRTPI